MKITRIETFQLKAPLGEKRFWSSQCAFGHRKSLLARIETDEGLVGWGEGGQYGPAMPVASMVHQVFAPMLLGRDPCQVEVMWDRLYSATRDFGRKGTTIEAISAVDIALWDIFGQAQGLPVSALMGGAFRSEVETYATGLYYRGDRDEALTLEENLPALREEAEGYLQQGFRAVKMKIGLLSPPDDLKRVAAVRETIGADMLLMVDANHAYQSHIAVQMARDMEQYDVFWFEEPVLPEDLEGYRQVKSATRIAIAGGECEYTRYGFAKWLTERALSIIQPDLSCAGGLSETRRIAAMASAFHVQCIPHVWGSAVALAAGLHLVAVLPPSPHTARTMAPYNEPMLEWDTNHNPLRTDLLTEPILPVQGKVAVPDAPGLGIEIDTKVLEQYLVEHTVSGAGK